MMGEQDLSSQPRMVFAQNALHSTSSHQAGTVQTNALMGTLKRKVKDLLVVHARCVPKIVPLATAGRSVHPAEGEPS